MGTVDNPDVYVQFYDNTVPDWVDLTQNVKGFIIRDAGILKIPQADVLLRPISSIPEGYERFRILVDTLGESAKMPFYGRVSSLRRMPQLGSYPSTKYRRLIAYGLEKRLKNDTITWKYSSEESAHGNLWTFKSMIEDFLVLPDSGYDTNLTLDTDSGNILNAVYGPSDFERESLLDALRIIVETIGYDGFVWIDGETAKLKFLPLGTLAASPATTLQDPFVRKPVKEWLIDEIRNYILVWGGVDRGYPPDGDKYSERTMAKNPAPNELWEALDGETIVDTPSDPADLKTVNSATSGTSSTLVDTSKSWTINEWGNFSVYIVTGKGAGQIRRVSSNTSNTLTISPSWANTPNNTSKYQIFLGYNAESAENVSGAQLSRYAVKASKVANDFQVRFRIDRTGVASIDLEKRFNSINFVLWCLSTTGNGNTNVKIKLTDVNDNRIQKSYDVFNFIPYSGTLLWKTISFPTLPPETEIVNVPVTAWNWDVGSSFDATQVKYLDIYLWAFAGQSAIFIDNLLFRGGLKIDPFQNPQYYPNYAGQNGDPANLDQTSIDDYGVRVYHHHNRDIISFEQADQEGDRILAVLKDLLTEVTVTKKGLEWLRPNQTVTLNSNSLGISSETWRTLELLWAWKGAKRPVYCTANLIEQNAKVPPVFGPSGEVPATPILPPWWKWFF